MDKAYGGANILDRKNAAIISCSKLYKIMAYYLLLRIMVTSSKPCKMTYIILGLYHVVQDNRICVMEDSVVRWQLGTQLYNKIVNLVGCKFYSYTV